MGEIAEMMLDGDLCEGCGVYMGSPGQGFPRRCPDCKKDAPSDGAASRLSSPRVKTKERSAKADLPKWKNESGDDISVRYHCNHCLKHFGSEEGARQHVANVHAGK